MHVRRKQFQVVLPPKDIWVVPSHGANAKPAIKTSTCRKSVDQFLEKTTLHGLQYVGDRTLTWFERYEKYHFTCILANQTLFSIISNNLSLITIIIVRSNAASCLC